MANVSSNRFESWPGLLPAVIQRLAEAEKRGTAVAVADTDPADLERLFLKECPPGRGLLRSRLVN